MTLVMKRVLVLYAAILAASAIPVDFGAEFDPGRHPDAFTTNSNYTNVGLPAGQAGYAATASGTHGGNGGAAWTVWARGRSGTLSAAMTAE